MKKIAIAFILFIIHTNISFAQSSDFDTLRKEVRKLLWSVENNFQENVVIWKQTNGNSQVYLNHYYIAIMKDTVNRLNMEVLNGTFLPKERREKNKLFRENIIPILDEYATENKWTKKYENKELDKKDKREYGHWINCDYYDSFGHKTVSIFDKQKQEMKLDLYGYPIKNTAEYKLKRKKEEFLFEVMKLSIGETAKKLYENSCIKLSEETKNADKYLIKDDAFDIEVDRDRINNNWNAGEYNILAIGFNLTQVQLLSRQWENDKSYIHHSSFVDLTDKYANLFKGKEMNLPDGKMMMEDIFKQHNFKIYGLSFETGSTYCLIKGVSSKWDEKIHYIIYRKKR